MYRIYRGTIRALPALSLALVAVLFSFTGYGALLPGEAGAAQQLTGPKLGAAPGAVSGGGERNFTEWGWPLPYRRISAGSVRWLKEKRWWPLQVAWQGPFSGQNTIMVVIRDLNLLGRRGIDNQFRVFESGPPINEAVIAARVHVGVGGNFPLTSLLDRRVPVAVLAVLTPNLGHAVVVPKDSPVQRLADFKGRKEPAVIGIVTGSSSEFYFQSAARVLGIRVGGDVILKNMPPAEQALLPKGVDAVVPWDPTVALITEVRKTGRVVDWIFPYNFYQGNLYVRREIVENTPDVAQAVADAYMEAILWIRLYPERALEMMLKDPALRAFSRELLEQQIRLYNLLYKPTVVFPHREFWAKENARIAEWLKENNRLQSEVTYQTYFDAFEPKFMTETFAKLGWRVPERPAFLPRDWRGEVGKVPYPDYYNAATLKTPQPFPERGDLVRPWWFGGKLHNP